MTFNNQKTICFIFSKFIYVNYKETFHFSKKESSYIAGSVYFVSMILAPVFGLAVVSQIGAKTKFFNGDCYKHSSQNRIYRAVIKGGSL